MESAGYVLAVCGLAFLWFGAGAVAASLTVLWGNKEFPDQADDELGIIQTACLCLLFLGGPFSLVAIALMAGIAWLVEYDLAQTRKNRGQK